MAKKNGFLGMIVDTLMGATMTNVKQGAEDLMDTAHKKALHLQEVLVQRVATAAVMFLSCLFFLAALLFFLVEDLTFTKAQAFALVGVLMLLLAFWFRYRALSMQLRA